PLAAEADRRYQEFKLSTGPGRPGCPVCGGEVVDPGDYLQIGHLSSDPADPLHRFNYLLFHRSHLRSWPERQLLRRELSQRMSDGMFQSTAYDRLLQELAE